MKRQPLLSLPDFNWLEEYGPYWKPGSTAFWLEPKTADQLIAWFRKYRPDFRGEFEAAGIRVNIQDSVSMGQGGGSICGYIIGAGGGGGGCGGTVYHLPEKEADQ